MRCEIRHYYLSISMMSHTNSHIAISLFQILVTLHSNEGLQFIVFPTGKVETVPKPSLALLCVITH